MTDALRLLSDLVRRETGLLFEGRRLDVVRSAAARLGDGTPGALLRRIADPVEGPLLMARLADELTVQETSFFRHADELAGLDWQALFARALGHGNDRLRVWSAGCATGEEAYTLAILALEAFSPGPAPVDVLATDLAPGALSRAAAGRYGERAVAPVPAGSRERWFERDGAILRVGAAARRLVRFERHNLVRDVTPPGGGGAFDVVVCRNVLIYFAADDVLGAIARLRGSLRPGGQLVLGAADRLTAGIAARARDMRPSERVSAAAVADRGAPFAPRATDWDAADLGTPS